MTHRAVLSRNCLSFRAPDWRLGGDGPEAVGVVEPLGYGVASIEASMVRSIKRIVQTIIKEKGVVVCLGETGSFDIKC